MSRIFEALKHAQMMRARKAEAELSSGNPPAAPDRRRNRRWALDVPVYVYGYGSATEPFHEEAHTLNVSATGALLLLSVPVQKGQQLLLTNQLTEREQDCRVVFLGTQHSRTVEAGVAFPATNPDFWQSHKSPEDEPTA
jgi:PilZ domain